VPRPVTKPPTPCPAPLPAQVLLNRELSGRRALVVVMSTKGGLAALVQVTRIPAQANTALQHTYMHGHRTAACPRRAPSEAARAGEREQQRR